MLLFLHWFVLFFCPTLTELFPCFLLFHYRRIYERDAIEQHIRMHQTNTLRSPVTNNPMGPKLLPSPQFKNLIETLIAQRSIEGDLRDAWKLKAQQKTNMGCMLQQANSGDAAAAHAVYRHYKHGKHGFPQDYARALHWLKVAHRAGNFKATATLGATFVDGKIGTYPVPRNAVEGMAFLSLAAHHGSDLAAQALGSCFTHGRYGLTVDTTVATYWLEKCLDGSSCRLKHLSTTGKARAQADLEQCRRIAGRAAGVDHPHNDDTFSGSDVDSLGVCPDQNAS